MLCSSILLSLVNSVLMYNLSISEKIKIVQLCKFSVWVLNLKLLSFIQYENCALRLLSTEQNHMLLHEAINVIFLCLYIDSRDKSGVLPSCTRVDGCHWQVFASHILCYHPKFRCTTLTSLLGQNTIYKEHICSYQDSDCLSTCGLVHEQYERALKD